MPIVLVKDDKKDDKCNLNKDGVTKKGFF